MPHWNVACGMWHVQDNIQGIAVERVTFTEVTKQAVQEVLQHPRQVSENLVESCKARRALDFLVGFGISPILWSKMVGSKSAGKEGGLRTHIHDDMMCKALHVQCMLITCSPVCWQVQTTKLDSAHKHMRDCNIECRQVDELAVMCATVQHECSVILLCDTSE